MQETLYAYVSIRDEYFLLPYSGGRKLREAIFFINKISVSTFGDKNGNFTVYFENETDKNKLEELYKATPPFMHLTRPMARSLTAAIPITPKAHWGMHAIFRDAKLEAQANGYNGYILKGDHATLMGFHEIHKKRFDKLPAVKLTKAQIIQLGKPYLGLDEKSIEILGLRAALMQIISYKKCNIPTAFLEIGKDESARLVVEPGAEGVDKLAKLLTVESSSLTQDVCHPKDDRAEQLKAVQVKPPIKQGTNFPVRTDFSDEKFPAIFTFENNNGLSEILCLSLINFNKKEYLVLEKEEAKQTSTIKFSVQACKDNKVKDFLSKFDYKNETAKRAASYLALRTKNTKEFYWNLGIFACCCPRRNPVSRTIRCKDAWNDIVRHAPSVKMLDEKQGNSLVASLPNDVTHYKDILPKKKSSGG